MSPGFPQVLNRAESKTGNRLIYVLSFLPSFVRNEIAALRQAGINLKTIMLSSPQEKASSLWSRITGDAGEVVYVADRPEAAKKAVSILRNAWLISPGARTMVFGRLMEEFVHRKDNGRFHHFRRALDVARTASESRACRIHTHFAWGNARVAAYAASLLRIPFSLTVHASDIFNLEVREAAMLQWIFGQADVIATISEYNKKYLLERYDKVPQLREKVEVIHCGIPTEFFEYKNESKPDQGFRVVTVPSGFVESKGLSVLLKAIKVLLKNGKGVECLVIGGESGELNRRASYEEEAARLDISSAVRFTGVVPQAELHALYQNCHAFVLPCVVASNGKMDGIPVSLMEAMAVGLPVISTPISGIPELIEPDRTGLMAAPGDPLDLANKIEFLMDNPDAARRLASAARQKIEADFDVKKTSQELIRTLGLQ
jgi:colanic acid/amylovoran biosynthesis glycosyltransferase